MSQEISRRSFVRGALAATSVAAVGVAGGATQAFAAGAYDYEADFVVVGSGTASYGAIAATEKGGSAIIVEKGTRIGGTTRLSGCCVWIPMNTYQVDAGYGEDVSADQILSYASACDLYAGSDDDRKKDYIDNAATFFKWIEDSWGFHYGVYEVLGDYEDYPGCKAMGRSCIHQDDDGNFLGGEDLFTNLIEPLVDQRGITTLLETTATGLIQDETGAIIGITADNADGTIRIKADKGVLLGAGGFDRNEQMRRTYLRGPIVGASSAEGNTGDGHRMGMKVGADLENMGSVWQCPFYVIDDSGDLSIATDWFEYAGLPGAIAVNTAGKRFCNENTAYGASDLAFWSYDSKMQGFANLPAYVICDADHVNNYGWPGYNTEQPEWFTSYDSLEELATACGIDSDGLIAEVKRFNEFAEKGVDEDFGRGENNYGKVDVAGYMVDRPELANPCMAPIATAPFYVAQIGPGTIGSCGGLKVDVDAEVLDLDGNVIPGLFACSNDSGAIMGSGYPGAGGTDGPGFYQAVRAANKAMGLGLF